MTQIAAYGGFIAFIVAMLAIDLKVFHTDGRLASRKESAIWVFVWNLLAVAFGLGVLFFNGADAAGEFFAGYLVEKALSVDNMFVFLVIFSYFKIKPQFQHKILFYGILGAIVFRGIFIAVGASLLDRFEWVIYLFGALLIFTAFRIAKGTEDVDPSNNPVFRLLRGRFRTTQNPDGQKFFTIENGKRVATPLFVVLLIVESTDIAFAIDSIPAIFAITRDPFIVLTSNVFAILGLRALYFLLAGSMEKFHLLKYGLAVILGFVGIKMLLSDVWHPGTAVSLGVIAGTLAVTAVASILIEPKQHEPPDLHQPQETSEPV